MVIHRRTGRTTQFALRPLSAVLFCIALIATGCSSSDGLKAGDAATFVDGFSGEVLVEGGDWEAHGDGDAVPDGARVRATDAEVRLALRDGTARLAPGAAAVVTEDAVQLERGDLLLDSDGGLRATVGDTDILAGGTVRVSSGLAASVGVYEGKATVRRPAQEREVTALRQLDLAAFRLAPAGEPLQYGSADAWDQELLGEAIAFDGEVARLARGMEIEFGTRPQPPAFYREFAARRAVPVLSDAAPVSRGRAFGPPSDVLLTMFVAQTIAQGSLTDTIRQVAQLRAAGARWGLISLELDVASDALVAAVDGLDSERLALAERAPETAQGTAVAIADPGSGTGGGRTGGANGDGPGATTTDGSTGTGGTSRPGGDGSGRGGGGDDGDGDGDGGDGGGEDPGDEEPEEVEQVVSDVVTTVEENTPPPDGDEDDDDNPLDGKGPPLPKLLQAPDIRLPKLSPLR